MKCIPTWRGVWFVLLVLTVGSLLVQAVSQGPNYAGAATATGWSSAANATGTPDGACASRSGASGGALDLTNFGFTIPDAATINGITVEVKFAGTTAGDDGVRVRLLKGGSPTTAKIFTPSLGRATAAPAPSAPWAALPICGAPPGLRAILTLRTSGSVYPSWGLGAHRMWTRCVLLLSIRTS
jgi:hypothetical protein